MPNDDQPPIKGFWQSITGIITAAATFVVAITGLIAVFAHNSPGLNSATSSHQETAKPGIAGVACTAVSKDQIVDCLLLENNRLREAANKPAEPPHLELRVLGAAGFQHNHLRSNVSNWISDHHGTSLPVRVTDGTVSGYVNDYSIGINCIGFTNFCMLVAAGPNLQSLNDALNSIQAN
jgi:hypothetical protein